MTRTLAALGAALVLALAASAAASAATARTGDEPGVTASSIVLGTTTPLTGAFSSLAAVTVGANAYLKHVNAHGGVYGRRITLRQRDDGYDPAQTTRLTRQLVEQDKVFAIFQPVGTEPALAVRDYLNAQKVPQLLVASGSSALGRDAARYPFTLGFQPSYEAEGWVYGKYLARTRAGARIAVLVQDDDYGNDLLGGLEEGLRRASAKVIAIERYSAVAGDVTAQVARLKASGADTFVIFAAGKFAGQAYASANKLGWRPKLVVTNMVAAASSVMTAAAQGGANKLVDASISGVFLKDPTDPQWRSDGAAKLYRQIMKRYAPRANASDPYHVYGMAAAFTLVELLRKAGKNPTRDGVAKAAASLDVRNPFTIPGITVRTGPGDRFPVEQMLLQRWSKGAWKSFGGLWTYRGSP